MDGDDGADDADDDADGEDEQAGLDRLGGRDDELAEELEIVVGGELNQRQTCTENGDESEASRR